MNDERQKALDDKLDALARTAHDQLWYIVRSMRALWGAAALVTAGLIVVSAVMLACHW